MTPIKTDKGTPSNAKRHLWARAEVRFILLSLAVIVGSLAIARMVDFRKPVKGPPIGYMAPAPGVVKAKSAS